MIRSGFRLPSRFTACIGLRSIKAPLLLALCTSSCSAACQAPPVAAGGALNMQMRAPAPKLSDVVDLMPDMRTFSGSVASAELDVYFDPRGGYIVADRGQNEVRAYAEPNNRLWAEGSAGPGPHEYIALGSAVRTANRQVIATDITGKLVVYDSMGKFQNTAPTGLQPLYSATVLDDNRLLLSGRRPGDPNTPLLHIWNIANRTIEKSFFPAPPHAPEFTSTYALIGWADAAVRGNTVAAIFPLADTLYLFTANGDSLRKLPIPLEHFRRLREPGPRNDTPEANREWRNSFTVLSTIHWAADGTLYLPYFRPNDHLTVWGLARLRITDSGVRGLFDVANAQQFLGASPRSPDLFFIAADELESTSWSIGRAKSR